MRIGVVGNIIGRLLIFLGLAKIVPLLFSIIYKEGDLEAILISLFITLFAGFLIKSITEFDSNISIKESFLFVTLSWIFAAAFGSLPYLISGSLPTFCDSFFEAMSGFTTTGATVIEDIEVLPKGILMWRSFTQWLGGMGIIALFVAVFPKIGVRGMNMLRAEVPGPMADRVVPRVAKTAKLLWQIYIVISVIEVIALMLAGLTFYEALNHTFTTMSTGGFSTRNASISGLYNPIAETIIIFFMFLAGGNFTIYYWLSKGHYRSILKDEEFKFYSLVVFVFIAIVSLTLWNYEYSSFFYSLRKGAFQVVSIITTTGYATDNFDAWPSLLRGLFFFFMFFGGCGGSTAGAIKMVRLLVLFKHSYREIFRMIHPKAVIPLKIGKKAISEEIVASIMGFMFLYIFIFIVGSLILTSMDLDIITSFSAVAATIGNVGPGLGLVGPVETYAFIPDGGKFLLSLMMLIGRLEIYTVIVLVLPEFRNIRNSYATKNSKLSLE